MSWCSTASGLDASSAGVPSLLEQRSVEGVNNRSGSFAICALRTVYRRCNTLVNRWTPTPADVSRTAPPLWESLPRGGSEMNVFADQLMIRYLAEDQIKLLLAPQEDTDRRRVRDLLASVYEPSLLEVRVVDDVTVKATGFQVPVAAPVTVRGSWEKVLPDIAQGRAVLEVPGVAPPQWIDLALEALVTARVELTSGALDAIASEDLSNFTEEEFAQRFSFIDLAELMRRAKVADFRELQEEFPALPPALRAAAAVRPGRAWPDVPAACLGAVLPHAGPRCRTASAGPVPEGAGRLVPATRRVRRWSPARRQCVVGGLPGHRDVPQRLRDRTAGVRPAGRRGLRDRVRRRLVSMLGQRTVTIIPPSDLT